MRMRFGFDLAGAKELEVALRALPDSLRKGVVERALVKAGEPIRDDAQARAPFVTGRLRRAINVATKLSRSQRRQRGKSKDVAEAFIGPSFFPLQEFGTGPRYHKSGKYVGQAPTQPFLRPAWEAGKDQALATLGELLWQQIEKAAKRLGRRAAKAKARIL